MIQSNASMCQAFSRSTQPMTGIGGIDTVTASQVGLLRSNPGTSMPSGAVTVSMHWQGRNRFVATGAEHSQDHSVFIVEFFRPKSLTRRTAGGRARTDHLEHRSHCDKCHRSSFMSSNQNSVANWLFQRTEAACRKDKAGNLQRASP